MKEYNVSAGHDNFSQRNNDIDRVNVCGPTNFAQCLGYAGWEPDMGIVPQFKQLDDKITYFTRTNKDVLKYYETHYNGMYNNWMREAKANAKAQGKKYWEVACINSYPPNEVHDVMSYAVNLFMGYTAEQLAKMERRPVTRFYNEFDEYELVWQICKKGLPVISSVDPFKKKEGHYISIVGFIADDSFVEPDSYNEVRDKTIDLSKIKNYIIDNTYGTFDFVNKKYVAVSGNDENIPREKLLDIIKPVAHYFTKGAATCC